MWGLSYIIALVFLLTGPSRWDAGANDDRATPPLNDRSPGHWPILFRTWPSDRTPGPTKPRSQARFTEIAGFFPSMFLRSLCDETNPQGMKPFSTFVQI